MTARELGGRLRLEKSSVSRMLRKLVDAGEVVEEAGEGDARVKHLSLTSAGKKRVRQIHAFGRAQVTGALERLKPGQDRAVLEGMRLYAHALRTDVQVEPSSVEIVVGYQVGLIARITQMHAHFYARHYGFGQRFESVVAGGLSEFCNRLNNPCNSVWTAVQDGCIVGSIAIDGEDLRNNVAHLRWFILEDRVRGGGVGRRLLDAALKFVDGREFAETHLWTFNGLAAARRLYEASGFTCVEEQAGTQWGKEVLEQRFVRPKIGRHAHFLSTSTT